LLNPPGLKLYLRDYYCSKVAKAHYSYAPIDLLMLSGRFEDLDFIDAIQARLTPKSCLDLIRRKAPAAIVSLVSAVSWSEDKEFLSAVKRMLPQTKILVSGDVVLEMDEGRMAKAPWLDAVILDFMNSDALEYLRGNHDRIQQMVFRDQEGRIIRRTSPRLYGAITDLPRPRHEMFLEQGYTYPFVRHRAFATVQSDYGCPFPCRFCVMARLGYGQRPVQEVITELQWLKELGVREIYFNDQTFGAQPARLEQLCRAMMEAGLQLGWCCWSRVDSVYPHLELMKRAGCHTIMFGVESASDETLRFYRKGFTQDQVQETFRTCRELGIRTLAAYLLGLPNEDAAMIMRTIEGAVDLGSDFASFNVYVPRQNSELRQEMALNGLHLEEEVVLDQSGHTVALPGKGLSPQELKSLRDLAMRRYYLRPPYILDRLRGVRTWYDLSTLFRIASSMLWS